MVNKKKFFSLVAGKIEVGQYIHQHYSRFIKIINQIENLYKTSTDKGKISVLDFGSHTGVLGIALKALGYDIYGIDLTEVIEANLSTYTKNEIKVQSLKNNWDGLPYPDNYFDCVIFSEVLEHLYESPIKFLEEIHRILKPGGNLLLTTPNVMRTENKVKFFLNINIYQDIERFCYHPRYALHFREYSIKDLKILLNKFMKYQNVKFSLFNYYGGRTRIRQLVQRIIHLPDALLPMFKSCILVVAQKK